MTSGGKAMVTSHLNKKSPFSSVVSRSALNPRSRQQGQAIIAIAFIAMVGAIVLLMVFNSGRAVNEKARLVNAADAATYSAGVEVARQLNFIAYTNRAMIANQIAAGHFVSFMSEADYAVNGINSIPILGMFFRPVTTLIENFVKSLFATYIVAQNELNISFSEAQQSNFDAIRSSNLIHTTLQTVVQGYQNFDNEFLLLDNVTPEGQAGLSALATEFSTDASITAKVALVNNQDLAMRNFIAMTNPANDNGNMIAMVNRSIATLPSAAWYTNRVAALGLKTGSSTLVLNNGGLDWQARDDFNLLGVHGRASAYDLLRTSAYCVLFPAARSCVAGYKGITSYAVVSNAAFASNPSPSLQIVAFVEKQLKETTDGTLDSEHQLHTLRSTFADKQTTRAT
ncbi:MAG TPA: pilus assembly protein TadG-related protein, partial [Pseudomonadales bacterium]|nr:pilus assembly protein TadG-related protein [Pseudomonadales bacterium]